MKMNVPAKFRVFALEIRPSKPIFSAENATNPAEVIGKRCVND